MWFSSVSSSLTLSAGKCLYFWNVLVLLAFLRNWLHFLYVYVVGRRIKSPLYLLWKYNKQTVYCSCAILPFSCSIALFFYVYHHEFEFVGACSSTNNLLPDKVTVSLISLCFGPMKKCFYFLESTGYEPIQSFDLIFFLSRVRLKFVSESASHPLVELIVSINSEW